MSEKVRQIDWTSFRFDTSWSMRPRTIYKRFSIVRTSDGFTVSDHEAKETTRVKTFALAKAWAGIRVNEQCIRHERSGE